MSKILDLIKKDSIFEGESKRLLMLLRSLLLLFIPYTCSVGLSLLLHRLMVHALAAFAFALLFLVFFIRSYKVRPPQTCLFTTILCYLYAYYFSTTLGWHFSFYMLFLVGFFLFWFDSSMSIKKKSLISAVTGLLLCFVCMMSPQITAILEPGSAAYTYLTYSNLVFCILFLSVIASFFCLQFVEAERQLYLYNKELKRISETDPLTKLPNRRFALEELKEIEAGYESNDRFVSIAIGDIDFFKRVNDSYGHDAGDYILSSLSGLLNEEMKEHGMVARWGGEEFLFVFDHANGDDSFLLLDTLREKIEHTEYTFGGQRIVITMTFGVEEYGPRAGIDSTIAAADKKLYLGKNSGRNKVVY